MYSKLVHKLLSVKSFQNHEFEYSFEFLGLNNFRFGSLLSTFMKSLIWYMYHIHAFQSCIFATAMVSQLKQLYTLLVHHLNKLEYGFDKITLAKCFKHSLFINFALIFFNWDSLHTSLNRHYRACSY